MLCRQRHNTTRADLDELLDCYLESVSAKKREANSQVDRQRRRRDQRLHDCVGTVAFDVFQPRDPDESRTIQQLHGVPNPQTKDIPCLARLLRREPDCLASCQWILDEESMGTHAVSAPAKK